jgi:hypothetical protein
MIAHDQRMTPHDFGVNGSKVKVTFILLVKTVDDQKLDNP